MHKATQNVPFSLLQVFHHINEDHITLIQVDRRVKQLAAMEAYSQGWSEHKVKRTSLPSEKLNLTYEVIGSLYADET